MDPAEGGVAMDQPETRYARAGDADIAYQVLGDGPVDLVWAFGLMTHLEVKWEEPSLAAMLRRLAEFSRLILFDRRGCGLSDRADRHVAPTLEERVDDMVAVLDAVGSRRTSILGLSEGCALAALFASMHPSRTESIILYGGISRLVRDEEHPWGEIEADELLEIYGPIVADWGTEAAARAHVAHVAPSMLDDPEYLAWFARQQRQAVSRDAVGPFLTTIAEYDMDGLLPAVRVPALVLHREGDTAISTRAARRLAERIPGATSVMLPGVDHLPYVGDADAVVDAIRDFLAGGPARCPADRQLLTLLATDAQSADDRARVRRHVHRLGGVEVTGPDGQLLARFGTATAAVRCGLGAAAAGSSGAGSADLRVGVHTGECEVTDGTVVGSAARVPAALIALAEPGQVLTSGTVRDVVPGSGIRFTDECRVHLPGVAEPQPVLTVVPPSAVVDASAVAPVGGEARAEFRQDGEYWTVSFEGRVVALADSKGMHDLAVLLAEPGRERHALDLWAGAGAGGAGPEGTQEDRLGGVGRPDPIIDDVARDRYRRRLEELELEAADAAARGDAAGATAAEEEREALVQELTAAYGLGGRARRLPDEAERARKAVRRRLASALDRIESADPRLGRHLKHSVHTGVYCTYVPEREVRWDTGTTSTRSGGV
jgi:pimeloyl-ACP methyl ester carboxylesterase